MKELTDKQEAYLIRKVERVAWEVRGYKFMINCLTK